MDSIASERYAGISCHTYAAYSKADLIYVYIFSMSSGMTPVHFNNLRAYNLLAALVITYST